MVLHGGTGLSEDAFRDLIARGCAKVNISTALKVTYMKSTRAFLKTAEPGTSRTRRRCSGGAAPRSRRWPADHMRSSAARARPW